jgi:hypothetical protein
MIQPIKFTPNPFEYKLMNSVENDECIIKDVLEFPEESDEERDSFIHIHLNKVTNQIKHPIKWLHQTKGAHGPIPCYLK